MTDLFVSNFLGLLVGIISSFISWWILFHVLIPKVVFGEHLRKSPSGDDASGSKYAFCVANAGRRRLIDVEITARLSVREERHKRWTNVILALDWSNDKKVEVPRMNVKGWLAYNLSFNETPEVQRSSLFSEKIRAKA